MLMMAIISEKVKGEIQKWGNGEKVTVVTAICLNRVNNPRTRREIL